MATCKNIRDWDNLSKLKWIESLNISFCNFKVSDRINLIPNLRKLTNLKELFLDEQSATDIGGIDKIEAMLPPAVRVRLINSGTGR